MGACSGGCCAAFTFPSTPKELHDRWHWHPNTSEAMRDDLFISNMLIPITPDEAAERLAAAGAYQTPDLDLVEWAKACEGRALYTCRHWDSETKLCTVYDERPLMCREYPYVGGCQHDCNCTYRPEPEIQTKWAAISVRAAVRGAE